MKCIRAKISYPLRNSFGNDVVHQRDTFSGFYNVRHFYETHPATSTISLISDVTYGLTMSPTFSGVEVFVDSIVRYMVYVISFDWAFWFISFFNVLGPQKF